jgi:hypothetical protein
MIPADFHTFFAYAASVSGALIGLLFVAISVSPGKLAGEEAAIEFQVKAEVAYTTLVNSLVVAMVALIPDDSLGYAALILAIFGVLSRIGFFVRKFAQHEGNRRRGWFTLVLLVGLYVIQGINGVNIIRHPHVAGNYDTQAWLIIVCFVVAIERAWEMLGAHDESLVELIIGPWTQRGSKQAKRS